MPGWIVMTKNGNRVKLLKSKLNQTFSNCAHLLPSVYIFAIGYSVHISHLLMVLGPGPLDVLPCSPSCSESSLVWQLFNLASKYLSLFCLNLATGS